MTWYIHGRDLNVGINTYTLSVSFHMNFECGMNSTILIAPKMDFPTSKDKPLEYKIKNTIFENNMFDSLN